MKYPLLLILLSFCSINIMAQPQYVVPNGTIYDSSGSPVSFATVKVQYVESNGFAINYEKTFSADINGDYTDSALIAVNDYIRVGALDCSGDTVYGPDQLVVQGQINYPKDVFICDSTPPINCNGTIQQFINGNSGIFSVNTTIPFAVFQWDINGTQYSGSTVSHTFPGPGMYGICATFNSMVCTFTVCDTVVIAGNPSGFDLAGAVFKSGNIAQSGLAFLYASDSTTTGTVLTSLDTTTIDSGGYYFNNLASGTYTVQAMLDPNDPDFLNFFPTYYGDVTTWSNASDIVLNSNSFQNDINLVPISSAAPGPGTITGSVVEGPNKTSITGDPLKDVIVMLRDATGTELEYNLTDANGEFNFSNIALGDYQILLEIVNENMIPYAISLNSNSSTADVNFQYDTLGVQIVLGFEDVLKASTSIYPNPAINSINVKIPEKDISSLTISINDLQGKERIRRVSENSETQIEINELPSGVYFLNISTGKGQITKRFVKQ